MRKLVIVSISTLLVSCAPSAIGDSAAHSRPTTADPAPTATRTPTTRSIGDSTRLPPATTEATPSPWDQEWAFHYVDSSGWEYDIEIGISYETTFSKDIRTSPPGEAKIASHTVGEYYAKATGTLPGREAPKINFWTPVAYYEVKEDEVPTFVIGDAYNGKTTCAYRWILDLFNGVEPSIGVVGPGCLVATKEATSHADLSESEVGRITQRLNGRDPAVFVVRFNAALQYFLLLPDGSVWLKYGDGTPQRLAPPGA